MHKTVAKALALIMAALMALIAFAGCSAKNPNPTVLKVGNIDVGMQNYYNLYSTYKSYYSYFGSYNVSTAEDKKAFQDTIFDMLVSSYLPLVYANKAGVTLTDEEKATIETDLATQLDSMLAGYADEVAETVTDEEAIKAEELRLFKADLKENGWTYDKYADMLRTNLTNDAISTKYLASIYDAEAVVTDEGVKAYYDELVATATADYAEDNAAFYTDYTTYQQQGTGVEPLVIPEGYRYCKHILIKYAAEGEMKDVDVLVAEVKDKLAAGEDFDTLVADYGEDPGMQQEPYMSEGYLISESTIDKYYEGFGAAAMALENVGDYTADPIETDAGYHFIQYTSDLEAGTKDFESVKDEITDAYTTKLQGDVYTKYLDEWKAETEIVKYYDRVDGIS